MSSNDLRYTDPLNPPRYTNIAPPVYNKLTISEERLRKGPDQVSVYELEVLFMHGDGDGNSVKTFIYDADEAGLLKVIEHCNFLARCVVAFPRGMGGDDGYWEVPGYEEFGEDEFPLDNEYCEGHASVEAFGVIYVNQDGVEFPTNLGV